MICFDMSNTYCDTRSPMTMCVINCFLFVHKFDIASEIVSRCAQNEPRCKMPQ